MRSRYPNRSVLSLLTHDEKRTNGSLALGNERDARILFVFVKSVPIFMSGNKIEWLHEGAGQDRPGDLWSVLGIRHWLASGKDEEIEGLYRKLLTDGQLIVGKYTLRMPAVTPSLEETHDTYVLDKEKAELLHVKDPAWMPPSFCEKENLKALSGYQGSTSAIQPVSPPGFFERDFLFKHLSRSIVGRYEARLDHLVFRGIRSTNPDGLGNRTMMGFLQRNFTPEDQLEAIVSNDGGKETGREKLSDNEPIFKMPLAEPTQKGVMRINGLLGPESAQHFALLQGVTGTVNMVTRTFRDEYGRTFDLDKAKTPRPSSIQAQSIYSPDFADATQAAIKLSDKFKELFDYLGPNVLIVDPYYIGDIYRNAGGVIQFSQGQREFINAVLRSVTDGCLQQLVVLGRNARANSRPRVDSSGNATTTDRMGDYQTLISALIQQNHLEHYFKDFKYTFWSANADLHNRYWFSLEEDSGVEKLVKCVSVSTSFGNMFDVDFLPITDSEQLRTLTARHLSFLKNAIQEL